MSASSLLLFTAVQTAGVVAPGPDFVLVLRNALRSGARSGTWTSCGIAVGVAGWIIITTAGVGGVILASHTAFNVLRYAGALYLLYLGVTTLISTFRGAGPDKPSSSEQVTMSAPTAFRQGLLCNALNPKAGVFFVALLPQLFGRHVAIDEMLAIVAIGSGTALGWFALVSRLSDRLGAALTRPRVARTVNTCVGVILTGIAAGLALSG